MAKITGRSVDLRQNESKHIDRINRCLGRVSDLRLLQVEVELPSGSDNDEGDGVDIDDLDSDVDCMEDLNGEVVAVRTFALEEQATACQMMLLLAEALQVQYMVCLS